LEAFGWTKTIGGLARPMRRGAARMRFAFTFSMVSYDLVRLPGRLGAAAAGRPSPPTVSAANRE
jgi:hypothetical protein